MSAAEERPVGIGRERQAEVYVGGARGRRPGVPVSVGRLEARARELMTPEAYAYVAGGAGTEETMRENRAAFERWRIVPRMLRDVSVRDATVGLFGTRSASPLVLSPIGVLELAHRDADLAVARAAAAEGVPTIFSNQASKPMEESARAIGDGLRWFQLYWSTSNEVVASFVSRAERCGCSAVVITLDTTMLGWRVRDLDLAYLPFLRGKGIAQYTSDPAFIEEMQETLRKRPRQPVASRSPPSARCGSSRAHSRARDSGTSARGRREPQSAASWRRTRDRRSRGTTSRTSASGLGCRSCSKASSIRPTRLLRSSTAWTGSSAPITAEGQVDGAIATMDALPAIVTAVDGQVPILLDSGVRSGADVFRALALGATTVGLGRPYVWGLAVGGEDGVRETIRNFRADFDLTMGLAGCASLGEISRESVVPRS